MAVAELLIYREEKRNGNVLTIVDRAAGLAWLRDAPLLDACEIEEAKGKATALQLLRRRNFDLVLTSSGTTACESTGL